MGPLMYSGVLLLCLLAGGEARRASSAEISQHGQEAELAAHMKSLGDEDPHHVCVTGNKAAEAVDSFMLQGTGQSRSDLPLTSLISEVACRAAGARGQHALHDHRRPG